MEWKSQPPIDRDGKVINIGDTLKSYEINDKTFTCLGFALAIVGDLEFWTVEYDFDEYHGISEYVSAKSCYHVDKED